MFISVQWMCQQKQSSVEYEQAESICRHIFYITEYRELTMNILRKFKPGILSKAFLRDLIIATHVYVRLMESLSKRGQLTKVERKRRKIRRRTKKKTIIGM
jgi:timeless